MPWKALSHSDFDVAVWKVVTIGPDATINESMEMDGELGSWTCRTSKPFSAIQRRIRR